MIITTMPATFGRTTVRSLSSSVRSLNRIKLCPDPAYDTGCTYCESPTQDAIDRDKNLPPPAGHVRQLIIHTGHSDWAKDIKSDTIVRPLAALRNSSLWPRYPTLLTACDLPKPLAGDRLSLSVFPDRTHFPDLPVSSLASFLKDILGGNEPIDPSQASNKGLFGPCELIRTPTILICGHTSRDQRCGDLAPLLKNEFEAVLEREGIKATISTCSHIGGHAFAGNVILHLGEDTVWYGRVLPKHVQGIVEETIKKGNLISELLRGMPFKSLGDVKVVR